MSVASLIEVPYRIAIALTMASNQTGTDYNYLTQTAARESNFQIEAKSPHSSASGLFQFINSTWLRTMKAHGARYGLGDTAKKIMTTRDGRHYVPNRAHRQKILRMRHDPYVAALMAGAYTNQNRRYVEARINRKATPGELYMAHFLGAADAVRLIELSQSRPNRRAWRDFPQAARSNRSIFYNRGRGRTVREVYILLQNKVNASTRTVVSPKTGVSARRSVAKRRPTRKLSPYVRRANDRKTKSVYARTARSSQAAGKAGSATLSMAALGTGTRSAANLLRGSLGIKQRRGSALGDSGAGPWVTKTEALADGARVVKIRRKKRKR